MNEKRNNGFSLIELMVVIALIALIAGISISSSHYLHKTLVRTELDLLYTTCFYLRNAAIAANKEISLVFDEAEHSYLFEDEVHRLPTAVRFGFLPEAKGPPSSANTHLQSAITFTNKKITFYPDGIISSGTVYLVDANRSSLYALSNGIAQFSLLRKYRYDGVWQLI